MEREDGLHLHGEGEGGRERGRNREEERRERDREEGETEQSWLPVRASHVRCQLRVSTYRAPDYQYSSKGVAVETGCSGLHYIIGCFII